MLKLKGFLKYLIKLSLYLGEFLVLIFLIYMYVLEVLDVNNLEWFVFLKFKYLI